MSDKKEAKPIITKGEEYKIGNDIIVREYREAHGRKEWRLNYKGKVKTPWFINDTNKGEITIGNDSLSVAGQEASDKHFRLYRVTKDSCYEYQKGEEYQIGKDRIVREYRDAHGRKEWRLNYKDKVKTPWFVNDTNMGEIAVGKNSLAVIGQHFIDERFSLYRVTKDECFEYQRNGNYRPEYFIQADNRTVLYETHHEYEERRAIFDFEQFESKHSHEYIRTLVYKHSIRTPSSYDVDEEPVQVDELKTDDLPRDINSRSADYNAFIERYQPRYYIKTLYINGVIKQFRGIERNDGKVAGILQDLDTGEIIYTRLTDGKIDDAVLGFEIRSRMAKEPKENRELLFKLSSEITHQTKKKKTVSIDGVKLNYYELLDDNEVVYRTNLDSKMEIDFSSEDHYKYTDLIDPDSFKHSNHQLEFTKLEEDNHQPLRNMKASIKADGLIINVIGVVDSNNELRGKCRISAFRERILAADEKALEEIANLDYANLREYINLGIVSRDKLKSEISEKAPVMLVKYRKEQL